MLLCRVVEFGCHRTSVYLHSYSASVRVESLWSVHSVLCMPLRSQKSSRSLMQSVLQHIIYSLAHRLNIDHYRYKLHTKSGKRHQPVRPSFQLRLSHTHAPLIYACCRQSPYRFLQKPSFAPMKMNGLSFQSAFFVPRSTISAGYSPDPHTNSASACAPGCQFVRPFFLIASFVLELLTGTARKSMQTPQRRVGFCYSTASKYLLLTDYRFIQTL